MSKHYALIKSDEELADCVRIGAIEKGLIPPDLDVAFEYAPDWLNEGHALTWEEASPPNRKATSG